MDIYIISSVVLLFSVVQSVFGVGILLFGTPTLLLLGLPFDVTLWTLLPSSVAISFIQIINHYTLVQKKRYVFYYTLPALIVSLIIVIYYDAIIDMKKTVGMMLILVGLIRFSEYLQNILCFLIKKHIKLYYVMMGSVHGVSNMGGGPLSVLMSSLYSGKDIIRVNIAFVYLIFGLSQLVVLSVVSNHTFQINGVLLIAFSLVAYLFIGKLLASKIECSRYNSLISVFILVYGGISLC